MSRRSGLVKLLISAALLAASSQAQTASHTADVSPDEIWHEFGLVQKSNTKIGQADATVYHLKDVTGALAAWEWQRDRNARPCTLDVFCSASGGRSVIANANYLLDIEGPLTKPQLAAFVQSLPDRHDTSLPAILNYVPRKNLVPNSARYVMGFASLRAFAPSLAVIQPGFDQGAEAQLADYRSASGEPLHLAVFYYPTPEMARLHLAAFKAIPGVQVKRSSVLLAVIFGGAAEREANALLAQIGYEAKITWNDIPPPSPIKPLYLLIRNIIYLSVLLMALSLAAGLVYGGIRLYRRRYGSLEEEEAMTTLNLTGD